MILRRPRTLWLLVYGTILAILIAVPLADRRRPPQGRLGRPVVRAVPIVGLGMPAFWLGIMLILLLAAGGIWGVFPVGGYGDGFRGHLVSMFLPALTVAIGTIAAADSQPARESAPACSSRDYVTTARAKGPAGAPGARAARAAQRDHADGSPCSASTSAS